MICDVCGNGTFRNETTAESFVVGGRIVLVEDIPARICERCGAANFSAEVAERVRRLVNEPHVPSRRIEAEVREYSAAS